MLRLRAILFVSLVLLCAGTRAQAVTMLAANLTHDQETMQGILMTSTGDPRPLSFGTATFVLNDAMTALMFTATIFNIDVNGMQTPDDMNDDLVNAHIHVGAPPGMNGPVRWGFFGMPDNDTVGDPLVVTPFAMGVGGTFSGTWDASEGNAGTTLATNLPGILAGLSYINFHTVQFGSGEIRGQIEVVPEPSTLLLLGSGLAVVLTFGRKRLCKKL
jgi:hypothetical protein